MNPSDPSRRTVLRGVGSTGAVAAVALTVSACGGEDAASAPAATASAAATAPAAASGTALTKVADVPVGGGVVLPDVELVVTQPTAGQFTAYSSICTHSGCQVSAVKDGFIDCACHGSRFAVATGAPTSDSPAQTPLAATAVTVKGADVVLG